MKPYSLKGRDILSVGALNRQKNEKYYIYELTKILTIKKIKGHSKKIHKMKKLLAICLLCHFVQVKAQQPFEVTAQLKNAKEGTKYYLQYVDNKVEVKDSTTVKNGMLKFTGNLQQDAVEAWVMGNFEGTLQYRSFWLGAGLTTITQNTKTLREADVKGSPANEHAAALRKLKEPIEKAIEKLETKAEKLQAKGGNPKALEQIEKDYNVLELKIKQVERNYIRQFPNNLYSLQVLHIMSTTYGADSTAALFHLMNDAYKQRDKGKDIQKYLALSKKIETGAPYVEVQQPDTSGNMLKLSTLQGKWMLLEFWASWCGPCRQENPELVKVYDEFKEKGFEIFAVSLDSKKDSWLEAIQKDKLPWLHVADLKGSYNEAALTYNINGIPDNLLINPKGIIVARGLVPNELRAYLEKAIN